MTKRAGILTILCMMTTLWCMAQTGKINGTVRTSDKQPAAHIHVFIKGGQDTVMTDQAGQYAIPGLAPGTYIVIATLSGHETKELNATVKASETTTLDFVLNETINEFNAVEIASAGSKYRTANTSSSLRLTTPILEIPQNIQVVSKDALKDQQVISMSDGLVRNVSGAVRMEHWGDLYTNITSRGSQIQAFRNGFNVVNSYWGPLTEDMSFVDHIEFVKGPAGFMLANGDPSGLYNVVTKKPTGQTRREVSLTLGSFDLYRTSLDLDGKLSKDGRLLYRLNVSAQNKKSHRAFEYNNRYVFAPVISYQVDKNTKLTMEYNFQSARMSDVGSYYVFSTRGFATLPRNFTSLPAGMPGTKINDHSLYLMLEHKISDRWKLTTQVSRFDYRQQGTSMWPSSVSEEGTMIRAVSSWDAQSVMTMGQVFVNGEVQTGGVRHRILGGLDMANKSYAADWGQYHELDSVNAEFNTLDPNYGVPVNGYPAFDYSTPLQQRAQASGGLMDQRYTAGYLQDELGFFDNALRVTLAGRYTSINQSEWGGPAKTAKQFTPRVGLSYSVNRYMAVYALYDQAFIPQNGKLANGKEVKPITGTNMEVGVKKDWFDGKWNTSFSVYHIVKNNEITADPNSPPASGLSIVMGQKLSKGFEFDIRGRIAKGLNLIANYANTDSRITKVADGITDMKVGDVVPGYAKHTANAWLNYTIQRSALKGLGFSGGFTYLSGRETYWDPSPDPDMILPDYLKVDAGLFWTKNDFRITFNVFNILDEYLYSGSYYKWLNAYNWQSEPGRNARVSINYKF